MEKSYKIGKAKLGGWIKEYIHRNGNSASHLFQQYYGTSVDGLIEYNDTSDCIDMTYSFYANGALKSVPSLDTRKVTDMSACFYGDSSLTTIGAMNVSKCSNFYNIFVSCRNLVDIGFFNIKSDLDITNCQKMQQENLHKLIDNLAQMDANNPRTLTLGVTLLDRVSEEYKQKARQKGWTLA